MDKGFKGLFDTSIDGETEDEPISSRDVSDRFMAIYGWVYQATIVAEHERIPLDKVYDMPAIQFLNNLAYLKGFRDYEKQQIKNYK